MTTKDLPFGDLGHSLILFEIQSCSPEVAPVEAAFLICEKLGSQLIPLMSAMGYHAILSRALAVARSKAPSFQNVELSKEGKLFVNDDDPAGPTDAAAQEASWILPAILLGLLVAFIGENITLRMISKIWPAMPHAELNFSKGHPHE